MDLPRWPNRGSLSVELDGQHIMSSPDWGRKWSLMTTADRPSPLSDSARHQATVLNPLNNPISSP